MKLPHLNKNFVISWTLRAKIIANGLLMFLTYRNFSREGMIADPISGTARSWWAGAALLIFGISGASLFSRKRKIRSLGLVLSSIMLLALGIVYALALPSMALGVWFILILGGFLMTSAGVVYFLPENLKNLVDLNDGIAILEKNILGLNKSLKELEGEVILLKEKILQDGTE